MMGLAGFLSLSAACNGSGLQPSSAPLAPAPRLVPAPAWSLCDRRETILPQVEGQQIERMPWGAGEALRLSGTVAGQASEYHLFFDDRGVLIGYIGAIYDGLDLASQPAYNAWLAQQQATEFLLPAAVAERGPGLGTGRLYAKQGERVTGQAVVIPRSGRPLLFLDAQMLTPYAPLLTPYRPQYLELILGPRGAPRASRPPLEREDSDALARQQFAKGEVAHFALCEGQDVDLAIAAYQRAITLGLREPLYQAEAHHRLGLAYRDHGRLDEAAAAIETSLKIRPAIPEVVNHLGRVYALMGDRRRAVEAFQTAIALRPNYAMAHFNLAEALEETNPKRALIAYENYLAFVEEAPAEQPRIAQVKDRVQALRAAQR